MAWHGLASTWTRFICLNLFHKNWLQHGSELNIYSFICSIRFGSTMDLIYTAWRMLWSDPYYLASTWIWLEDGIDPYDFEPTLNGFIRIDSIMHLIYTVWLMLWSIHTIWLQNGSDLYGLTPTFETYNLYAALIWSLRLGVCLDPIHTIWLQQRFKVYASPHTWIRSVLLGFIQIHAILDPIHMIWYLLGSSLTSD